MSHIIGLIVIFIGIVTNGAATDCIQKTCNPEVSMTFTELLPIPTDCTKFIMCNGIYKPFVMNCPKGLHFNQNINVCDWPKDAGCIPCPISTDYWEFAQSIE